MSKATVTAREISQMFGELIGLWCAATWQQIGNPTQFKLVELGPGRGTLMADALRAGRASPVFRRADINLIETSPPFRHANGKRSPRTRSLGTPASIHFRTARPYFWPTNFSMRCHPSARAT